MTLPQRKVRYYEAMSRLKAENGDLVAAGDFLAYAEAGALMPKLDNLSVLRCVQVVRRLLLKNRDIGLFCNLSGATLTDSGFPKFLEFMDANRAIAPHLVFEFTQSAVRAMGPIEHESLAALAERGFRFSMDNLTDLRVDARELNERGFRFVKAPATLLFNRVGAASTDIHPADFSDLLGRFGIDLIAERIESESMVVDLLDYDVRFGQGFLFSPPRPVRAEALQGLRGERQGRRQQMRKPAPATRPERRRCAAPRRQPRPTRPRRHAAHLSIPSSVAIRLDFIERFEPLARDYDVLFCDVWGVVHNGIAAFAPACDALLRFRGGGGTAILHHQCAARRRRGGAHPRPPRCAARSL